jgi:nicotinamidase/pyrazinamidase
MRALLLIDLQYDFMPGGALAVPDGDAVIPIANRLLDRFDFVAASQDWHPENHRSFASRHPGRKPLETIDLDGVEQVLWPDHCVQGTRGAELHEELRTGSIDRIVRKGTDPSIDSYSAFFDNAHRRSTGLDSILREQGVDEVVLLGLATDYCVLFSALDALGLGYTTLVVRDGCRGIDQPVGSVDAAWDRMEKDGARIVNSEDVR